MLLKSEMRQDVAGRLLGQGRLCVVGVETSALGPGIVAGLAFMWYYWVWWFFIIKYYGMVFLDIIVWYYKV